MNTWSIIRELKGETLKTLSRTRKRKFKIIDVCENYILIFIFSSQKERKITRKELEKSAGYLFAQKSLTRAEIRALFSVANPAYVAGILARMPSVEYQVDPITLFFRGGDSISASDDADEDRILNILHDIRTVDFREFWWDSPLLQRCARIEDPRMTKALLFRHSGLMNKKADSAHVLRNTIKATDGPSFITLWGIIDTEDNPTNLELFANDPAYLPWAAVFVLGEIGGVTALTEIPSRLSDINCPLYPLFIKLLTHLLIRYNKIKNQSEPMTNMMNLSTGLTKQVPASNMPDVHQRIMRRREQENEYFKPIYFRLRENLKNCVNNIPNRYLFIEREKIIWLVEELPLIAGKERNHTQDSIHIKTRNRNWASTGKVTREKDGRFTINVDKKSDTLSLLMSMGMIFYDDLSYSNKIIFSKWAELPHTPTTEHHYKAFSLAFMHYMDSVKKSGHHRNPKIVEICNVLIKDPQLPPLPKPFSPQVQKIFDELL